MTATQSASISGVEISSAAAGAPEDLTTALELAGRLRRREVSSVELTRATFATIAEKDPRIHAFVELDERRALRIVDFGIRVGSFA